MVYIIRTMRRDEELTVMDIADILKRLEHPKWNDDEIFHEAKELIQELLKENDKLKVENLTLLNQNIEQSWIISPDRMGK